MRGTKCSRISDENSHIRVLEIVAVSTCAKIRDWENLFDVHVYDVRVVIVREHSCA